jgi:cytochrome c biogenesis protein CcdA
LTSADRLFAYFSLGFAVLAIHWAAVALVTPTLETRHEIYIIRLAAFLLIIVGIIDKNRRRR